MADVPTIDIGADKLDEDKSDYDLLNDHDKDDNLEESKDKEDEDTDKEDKEEKDEELPVEEDEEIEENEEEELPETKLRPSIKSITKEFPEAEKIFKKYPQLRDAYYREGKFSQLYATIEDAEEASVKAESLDAINADLMDGNTKDILQAINKDNPDSFKKIAANFLPTLQSLDENLFYETAIPLVNTAIRNLYLAGQKSKDNNMMGAAKIMAHFFHGSYDIPASTERAKDPELENERKKLQDEKNSIEREKFTEFDTSVNDRTRKFLSRTIEEGLDPNKSLSDFTKSKIIDEIIDRVGTELSKDRQHMASINKLWKLASQERFSAKSADRIISAFLSRAKQLIPEIRSKVKSEALGTRSKSSDNGRRSTTRETTTGTRVSEKSSRVPTDSKKLDKNFWRTHSDADLLK